MSEHTNLPWRRMKGGFIMAPDEGREVQIGKIGDFSDRELLPFNKKRWQADIELIVKAVNNHDAIVTALRKATNWMLCDNEFGDPEQFKTDLAEIKAILGAVESPVLTHGKGPGL